MLLTFFLIVARMVREVTDYSNSIFRLFACTADTPAYQNNIRAYLMFQLDLLKVAESEDKPDVACRPYVAPICCKS